MSTTEGIHVEGLGRPLPRLIAGTARDEFLTATDADRILDDLSSVGVTALDTARAYLRSEETIGDWMRRRDNRESVTIITKGCHPTPTDWRRVDPLSIRHDVDESRKQLHTDYIDLFLLHRDDPAVNVEPIIDTLNDLQQAGAIRAFGASNWTHHRIEEANAYARAQGLTPFVASSPNFGLAVQVQDPWGFGSLTITGPENNEARQWYRDHAIPVIAWAPLGRGFFSGRVRSDDPSSAERFLDAQALAGYAHPQNLVRLERAELIARRHDASVPQIALAWLFAQPLETAAVVSAAGAARMQQNLNALTITLSDTELAYLDLATE
ncbi:aldo/keto reductase [Microbacterium sp. NPDC056044]|uniref:aldo/keto reductase n=1 Tax=Microbacterium sp. NPDC056044 TaxID=3345690 RepID=UPI0035DE24FD